MRVNVKSFFASLFVFLLVGTTFGSSLAFAEVITPPAVTSPPPTTVTPPPATVTPLPGSIGSTSASTYTPTFSQSSSGSFSSYSGASYTNYQSRPGFQTYYPSGDVSTYWPILGDAATCQGRQDLLLQVAPFGCQP